MSIINSSAGNVKCNTSGIHYYAIRHDATGMWMGQSFEHHWAVWTYNLRDAIVWQPDDMEDEALLELPPNCHW